MTGQILCEHGKNLAECEICGDSYPSQLLSWLGYRRFVAKIGTYHLTAVVGCLRRTFYDFTQPESETLRSLWMKQRGRMLHMITHAFGWRELPVCMQLEYGGRTVELVGHVDAYDPNKGVVYEFKTTSHLPWQLESGKLPHVHHVNQIRGYDVLLSNYGLCVNQLELWYMDDLTPPTKIIVQRENIKEWLVDRTKALHKSLLDNEEPASEPSYICKYCLFSGTCKPRFRYTHQLT